MRPMISLLAIGAVEAVTFSAWDGLSCRGAIVRSQLGTQPYSCYYIGSSASIKASGLSGDGNSEYQVFSDTNCKTLVGQVKYNDICQDYNFLSVVFIPPAPVGAEKQEITLPEHGSEAWRHRQLLLAKDGHALDNSTQNVLGSKKHKSNRRQRLRSGRRNTGDQFTSGFDGIVALDEADDNNEGTADFTFIDDDEEFQWGGIVLDRLADQEAMGPVTEYNGAQIVNGRTIELTLRPNQGTMNQILGAYVANGINLFLQHRVGLGRNVWQIYQNGEQLFQLIFSAVA